MDDGGTTVGGIEFSKEDAKCKYHPELWLDPSEIKIEEKPPTIKNT